MKLKTLLFSGMIATMIATPVFAMGSGHSCYVNYDRDNDTMCNDDFGPEHGVHIRVTHNRSANQTYALAACGCTGYSVGSKIILGGNGREVHARNYAQTTSLTYPADVPATEIHRVDYKL